MPSIYATTKAPVAIDPTLYLGQLATAVGSNTLITTIEPGVERININSLTTRNDFYNGLKHAYLNRGVALIVFVPNLQMNSPGTLSFIQLINGNEYVCGSRYIDKGVNQWLDLPLIFAPWDELSLENKQLVLKVTLTLPSGTVASPAYAGGVATAGCFVSALL